MRGLLISFEGIDFSGKSLQASLLNDKLSVLNIPVFFLREPGGTTISEKIRTILLDDKHLNMTARAELLLYSAARTQMVAEQIIPNIEKGKVVICDRYYDSTTAYQGFGRQIDLDFIKKLNNFVTQNIRPDLTFLIDLDPETALCRTDSKKDRFDRLEQEDIEFHQRVREGYLKIAYSESEKERFVVIDGSQSVETIQGQIFLHVKSKMKL